MNLQNDMLDMLVARERYEEYLKVLGPQALAVVALLMEDGLNQRDAAELLGITRAAASMRLALARGRLVALYPWMQRKYKSRGVVSNRCPMCGRTINRPSIWCRRCAQQALAAARAAEQGQFTDSP